MAVNDPLTPPEGKKKFRYHGSSMRATFTPGQVLYVRPDVRDLRPGDVVVYQQGEKHIVHRVTVVEPGGIRARGDNNPREDEGPIPFDALVGVVESAEAQGGVSPVTGGQAGLRRSRLRWGLAAFLNRLSPALGAPYRWLKARRWVGRFWRPPVQRLQLSSPDGLLVKYILRGKVVATWQPEKGRFFCRKPYDLVLFPPEKSL